MVSAHDRTGEAGVGGGCYDSRLPYGMNFKGAGVVFKRKEAWKYQQKLRRAFTPGSTLIE